MNDEAERKFRELKSMEFEAVPGLVFSRPKFRPSRDLSYLMERVGIRRSQRLVGLFKDNEEFVRLFMKAKPARLKVVLDSFPDRPEIRALEKEVRREVMVSYFYRPERIRFYVSAATLISSPLPSRTLRKLLDLVLVSGKILRGFLGREFGIR